MRKQNKTSLSIPSKIAVARSAEARKGACLYDTMPVHNRFPLLCRAPGPLRAVAGALRLLSRAATVALGRKAVKRVWGRVFAAPPLAVPTRTASSQRS